MMHANLLAIQVARTALQPFQLPSSPVLSVARMSRRSGAGPHGMTEGHVLVGCSLRTASGHTAHFDLPIVIRGGLALAPAVLIENGVSAMLTQNALDAIVARGTLREPTRDRASPYTLPPARYTGPRASYPVVRPGMFTRDPSISSRVFQGSRSPAALIRAAMRREALPDHLDVAEREPSVHCIGDEVDTVEDCEVYVRAGVRYFVPKGSPVSVIRDRDGHGQEFLVHVIDQMFDAFVPASVLG